ncbi:MAG: MFS transporter [Woeseia sp.]
MQNPGLAGGASTVRWRILALIIAASFISYVLRTNVSVVGETMIDDLGLTEVHLGMIFSSFALGYALFQIPGGVMGDRMGSRLAVVIIAVAWALLTVFTASVPGTEYLPVAGIVGLLIVLRFLVGATHAPIFPVTCGGTIANWFPAGGWGLPNGLSSTGLTLGAAATAPLLVWLMEGFGWRGALLLTAPSALLLAGAWWWYVRDYPRDHKSVSASELALIDAGRPPPEDERVAGAWKVAIKNRDVLLLTGSYFCMNYVFYLFFNWFFFYLVDVRGFSARDAGMLTSAQWILGAAGATAGGFICDWLTRRYGLRWGPRWLAIPSLVLCAVFLVLGATSGNTILTVTFLCICFGCTQLTEAAYWATTISVSGRHAAAASGILNTGGNVVGFAGGMMVPLIATVWGWTVSVSTGAVFALLGALLWLLIRGDRQMVYDND